MAQVINSQKTFGKKCKVTGRDGDFWLVRQGRNNSRVFPIGANQEGEGELVKTADLVAITKVEAPAPEVEAPAPTETVAQAQASAGSTVTVTVETSPAPSAPAAVA